MTYKELKSKGMTCDDYLNFLLAKGYVAIQEVIDEEASR